MCEYLRTRSNEPYTYEGIFGERIVAENLECGHLLNRKGIAIERPEGTADSMEESAPGGADANLLKRADVEATHEVRQTFENRQQVDVDKPDRERHQHRIWRPQLFGQTDDLGQGPMNPL